MKRFVPAFLLFLALLVPAFAGTIFSDEGPVPVAAGGGGITKVQSVTGAFTTGTTNSKAITSVVAGHLLTIQISWYTPSLGFPSGLTDSASTPTFCNGDSVVPSSGGARTGSESWVVMNASAGTHTFGYPLASGGDVHMTITEWSGFPTTGVVDQTPAGQTSNSAGVATIATNASATLAQANELVLAEMVTANTGPGNVATDITNPPAGYTSLYYYNSTNISVGAAHIYKIVAATTAISSIAWTWTNDSSTNGTTAELCTLKGF